MKDTRQREYWKNEKNKGEINKRKKREVTYKGKVV